MCYVVHELPNAGYPEGFRALQDIIRLAAVGRRLGTFVHFRLKSSVSSTQAKFKLCFTAESAVSCTAQK